MEENNTLNTWIIDGDEALKILDEVSEVFNKRQYPLVVEMGLIEMIKEARRAKTR